MTPANTATPAAHTMALRRALRENTPPEQARDLLFLEAWERAPASGIATALRVGQIRRANPGLAAEIRTELDGGRPLTALERTALAAIAAPGRAERPYLG